MTRSSFEAILKPVLANEIKSEAPSPFLTIFFTRTNEKIECDSIRFFDDYFMPGDFTVCDYTYTGSDGEYPDEIHLPYSEVSRILFFRDDKAGKLSQILINM